MSLEERKIRTINRGIKLAKKNQETIYVIYEDSSFCLANDYELDTFFQGATPIMAIEADGYCS